MHFTNKQQYGKRYLFIMIDSLSLHYKAAIHHTQVWYVLLRVVNFFFSLIACLIFSFSTYPAIT